MNEYQFYIDGTLLEDEPLGWNDSTIKLVRNSVYNGLFLMYFGIKGKPHNL